MSFHSVLVGLRLSSRKELSEITKIRSRHVSHNAVCSQQRPNAYLFAQVETNQPDVLGISSGLLVLAAPLRCAVCAVWVLEIHRSRQQWKRVYEE